MIFCEVKRTGKPADISAFNQYDPNFVELEEEEGDEVCVIEINAKTNAEILEDAENNEEKIEKAIQTGDYNPVMSFGGF